MIMMQDEKIVIEQYRRMVEITEERIVIICADHTVYISGKRLCVKGLNKYDVTVQGKIESLSFHETDA